MLNFFSRLLYVFKTNIAGCGNVCLHDEVASTSSSELSS